ncbi:hypothetical protein DAETH_47090 (plasmid) [Deinococcus aetherius]|uniref:DUF2892 domain-containing protein n=1 Tax=Deinococcus aetherius TaxID=200252 RepID=A0ABN6RN68_9DEIO|nr:hypothetical protein [Deinococcus aetherius]BDP44740.1 hypothetical protein DAETH_47090 [Deinococcus aetherius]
MNLLRFNEKVLIGLGLVAAGVDFTLLPVTFGTVLLGLLVTTCLALVLLTRRGSFSGNFRPRPGLEPQPARVPAPAAVPVTPVRR